MVAQLQRAILLVSLPFRTRQMEEADEIHEASVRISVHLATLPDVVTNEMFSTTEDSGTPGYSHSPPKIPLLDWAN
jgi:hypothetical protein